MLLLPVPNTSSTMRMQRSLGLVVLVVTTLVSTLVQGQDLERIVTKLGDCLNGDQVAECFVSKGVVALRRLSRMKTVTLVEGLSIVQDPTAQSFETGDAEHDIVGKEGGQLEHGGNSLAQLVQEGQRYLSSRKLQIQIPKSLWLDDQEESRGKKKGSMMGQMMMGIAAKMAALVPIAIAGLFLMAGKALIIAKIALLISGIIAIKKLFAQKGGGGGGGWQSGGGGGGWQSGGGGGSGWDRRSLDAHKTAYSAYVPTTPEVQQPQPAKMQR